MIGMLNLKNPDLLQITNHSTDINVYGDSLKAYYKTLLQIIAFINRNKENTDRPTVWMKLSVLYVSVTCSSNKTPSLVFLVWLIFQSSE
jgi:hypothetical protein